MHVNFQIGDRYTPSSGTAQTGAEIRIDLAVLFPYPESPAIQPPACRFHDLKITLSLYLPMARYFPQPIDIAGSHLSRKTKISGDCGISSEVVSSSFTGLTNLHLT